MRTVLPAIVGFALIIGAALAVWLMRPAESPTEAPPVAEQPPDAPGVDPDDGPAPEPESPETVPRPVPGSSVRLVLSAASKRVGPGERIKLSASLVNEGTAPITVMLPIDGCDVGWRVVDYSWEVTRTDGTQIARVARGRCGNTNGIEMKDFQSLAPGGRVQVPIQPEPSFLDSPEGSHKLNAPGAYRIRLVYTFSRERTDPSVRGSDVSGRMTPGTQSLLADATEVQVTSNIVTVTRTP